MELTFHQVPLKLRRIEGYHIPSTDLKNCPHKCKLFSLGFVEEPLSLNLTIGEEAVFRCEHRSADAIFWRINGTSLRDRPDLSDGFKEIIGQLTVTSLTKYNNTLIQCVALFHSDNSQPETTAPATLKIQG